MTFKITAVLTMIALAAPAFAEGDAAAGEKEFKKCKSCHAIESDSEVIVKGGKTGPNLYGIAGRVAGSVEGFKYSDILAAAGAKGLAWDEESFVGYVQDPTEWLKEYTGEDGRAKMTYKVRKEEDARNLWAYLLPLGQ